MLRLPSCSQAEKTPSLPLSISAASLQVLVVMPSFKYNVLFAKIRFLLLTFSIKKRKKSIDLTKLNHGKDVTLPH